MTGRVGTALLESVLHGIYYWNPGAGQRQQTLRWEIHWALASLRALDLWPPKMGQQRRDVSGD